MKVAKCSLIAVVASVVTCMQTTDGFQSTIFNGAGIRMTQEAEAEPASNELKFKFPRLFSNDAPEDSVFGRPPRMPRFNWFQSADADPGMESDGVARAFQNMPRIFPARESEQENWFGQWNQKSRDFFAERKQKLEDWASRTNENMRQRTSNTWDSLTRGLTPGSDRTDGAGPLNWLRPKTAAQEPAQPPIRSAQVPRESPKIKF